MMKEIVDTKEEALEISNKFLIDMKTAGIEYEKTELKNSILIHNKANVVKFVIEFDK